MPKRHRRVALCAQMCALAARGGAFLLFQPHVACNQRAYLFVNLLERTMKPSPVLLALLRRARAPYYLCRLDWRTREALGV